MLGNGRGDRVARCVAGGGDEDAVPVEGGRDDSCRKSGRLSGARRSVDQRDRVAMCA